MKMIDHVDITYYSINPFGINPPLVWLRNVIICCTFISMSANTSGTLDSFGTGGKILFQSCWLGIQQSPLYIGDQFIVLQSHDLMKLLFYSVTFYEVLDF